MTFLQAVVSPRRYENNDLTVGEPGDPSCGCDLPWNGDADIVGEVSGPACEDGFYFVNEVVERFGAKGTVGTGCSCAPPALVPAGGVVRIVSCSRWRVVRRIIARSSASGLCVPFLR